MPSDADWKRRIAVTECEGAIARLMLAHEQRDISIWMAAFVSQLKRLSDLQLLDDDETESDE